MPNGIVYAPITTSSVAAPVAGPAPAPVPVTAYPALAGVPPTTSVQQGVPPATVAYPADVPQPGPMPGAPPADVSPPESSSGGIALLFLLAAAIYFVAK